MGRLDDPQIEGRLLLGMADFITVLLLTAGSALAFLSGYSVETDLGAVLFFCAFASAVSTLLHSLARPWWSIAAAGAIALIFCPAWGAVMPVLRWLGQKMGVVSVLTGLPLSAFTPDKETLLPILLLLCAVLAWVMGWMAVRVRRWYLAALLSFTLVLPAIQSGVLPMWGAMLAAFTGWGAMLLTALYGRRDPGGLGRAQLLSLGGMGALVLILVLTLPMGGYLRPQWATDTRTRMIRGVTSQLDRFFDLEELNSGILADLGLDLSVPEEADGTGGGIGSGNTGGAFGSGQSRREDLLHTGPRRYGHWEVMEIETDEPDPAGQIYLLGGTLNTYTGESWEDDPSIEDQPGLSPMMTTLFPAATAPESENYTMTVRYTALGGTWYYPYRFAGGAAADESGYLSEVSQQFTEFMEEEFDVLNGPPGQSRQYHISYRPGGPSDGFFPLEESWAEMEALYRRQNPAFEGIYLAVPEELQTVLRPLLDDLGRESFPVDPDLPEQFQGPIAAAARTAELLSERAVYDLDALAMEPGEDFIEHFLTEGRGYCVHFATAGAMLLRMQGIPARYATGYVANLDSQGHGRVLDSGAHAWVEIYLDGYGWYPVEMTPGYAGGESGVELAGGTEADETGETDEPEPGETPEDEVPEDEVPADGAPEEPEDDGADAPSGGEPEEAAAAIHIPWRTIGKAALVLAALGGGYGLALLARQRARTDPDANRSALNAYRRYSRVLRLGGAADGAMEELGRKAKFSQHTLTEEERSSVWQRLEQTVETAKRRQKKWKRWLLSLLRPLL